MVCMEQQTQRCPECELDLPLNNEHFARDRNRLRGFTYQCKACKKKYEKKRGPIAHAKRRLKKHGISHEEYKAMEVSQDGRCAICGRAPSTTFHIDHCHKTGMVRGLLCSACNVGLGHFEDNPITLQAAIDYLKGVREISLPHT